jgi:hypothetical protein
MRRVTMAILVVSLLAFSGVAMAQLKMEGMQMPQMMEQMSQGKMSPESQKHMAEMMKACPMKKMMSDNPQMMEQMSQGKLSPEVQKQMAENMKSCPMMKMK